jgi:predicted CXXCH cytochrome family protein
MALKIILNRKGIAVTLVLLLWILNCRLETPFAETCLDCHDDQLIASAHSGVSCSKCHVDVVDETHEDDGASVVDCGRCHKEQGQHASLDLHVRLIDQPKDRPSCLSCHGGHDSLLIDKIPDLEKAFCASCHQQEERLEPSFHGYPVVENESCTDCHDDEKTPYTEWVETSIHEKLLCSDCHGYIAAHLSEHEEEELEITALQVASCQRCHGNETEEHRQSIHGIALLDGLDDAAQCWDCHGSHQVVAVAEPESPVHFQNLPQTCARCHEDPELIEAHHLSMSRSVGHFADSVHGKLVAEGKLEKADCTMCHGVHDIKNRMQSGSAIAPAHIVDTCGKCHEEIAKEFRNSIHWIQAKKGVKYAPVCNDCHVEHTIPAFSKEKKAFEVRKLQEETCFRCHQNPIFAQRFGWDTQVPDRYLDSYHGLATRSGDEDSATCVDCHGVHSILPRSHPESMVHETRVVNTCRQCHEKAGEVFAKSYSHQSAAADARKMEYWVRWVYVWLIFLVIGGMAFHNGAIVFHHFAKRRKIRSQSMFFRRFQPQEVWQHFFLASLFIILAITGFALKYPDSWWTQGLKAIGMTEGVRQLIHRVSAVLMVVLSLYHIIYFWGTPGGRQKLWAMLPQWQDIPQGLGNLFHYLGLKKEAPRMSTFSYEEKLEYWALVWGTIIMSVTGLFLWFPTLVGSWAPTWFIKVSEIIHYYEAILATLAILVWHLFLVFYRPHDDAYVLTMWDGKLPLSSLKHHHAQAFEQLAIDVFALKEGLIAKEALSYETQVFLKDNPNLHEVEEALEAQFDDDAALSLRVRDGLGALRAKKGSSAP